jgi:hypothetical protein
MKILSYCLLSIFIFENFKKLKMRTIIILVKALLYKGFRGILKNFQQSGTLLDSSVPLLQKVQSTKIKM